MSAVPAERNVFGEPLQPCSDTPLTGFYRDGSCNCREGAVHAICVEVTADFLAFSKSRGNDLSTPQPAYNFPGLKPGDSWCLVAMRWREAFEAGMAPRVRLQATNEAALRYVEFGDLKKHALDLS